VLFFSFQKVHFALWYLHKLLPLAMIRKTSIPLDLEDGQTRQMYARGSLNQSYSSYLMTLSE
jgi:hypothetical protein